MSTHRIAVVVDVGRLRCTKTAALLVLVGFGQVFMICVRLQDSGSRLVREWMRLSRLHELDECACLLGALSGPTTSSPCSHGRGSVWLAP